jgi:hypothetical protein
LESLRRRDEKASRRTRLFPTGAQVKIVRAECGDDAGLLGAARLGFDSVAESESKSRGLLL